MKHTPGPWEIADAGGYEGFKYQLEEYFVRRPEDDVAIASEVLDPDTCKPSEANARLIAAAPDLLAACQEFLAAERIADEFGIDDNRTIEALVDTSNLARNAIAKTKGE